MIRALIIFAVLIGVAVAANWFMEHDGQLTLQWLGYDITTSVSILVAGVVAAVLVLYLAFGFLHWLFSAPSRLRKRFEHRRHEKGYHNLMQGFTDLAAGDVRDAEKHAAMAQKLLGQEPPVLLLAAQSAHLSGKKELANQHYQKMLEGKDSRFLGLRGLLSQFVAEAQFEGEAMETALSRAEQAYKLKPSSEWVNRLLVELYGREGKWQEAEAVIKAAKRRHVLPNDELASLRAVIHYSMAEKLVKDKQLDAAIYHLEQASKAFPVFAPAALMRARLLLDKQEPDKAREALYKAWKARPHRELALAYRKVLASESAGRQQKAWQKLLKLHPHALETHILAAELAIEQENWTLARNHVKSALSQRETRAACQLMVKIEQYELGQHSMSAEEKEKTEASIQRWREKAVNAPADPVWMCGECGHVSKHYSATCTECRGYHTVNWSGEPVNVSAAAGKHTPLALMHAA